MTLPPPVPEGATVAVCAPAAPVNSTRLQRGLDRLGNRFRLRLDAGLYTTTGFLAGSDQRRADELDGHLRDPDVRAIVMARGGYGLMRILDLLDADALRRDPKLLIGFSDGTALLSWAARAGVRGIHGPVVNQLGDLGGEDEAWLYRLMESRQPLGELPWQLAPIGARPAQASGGEPAEPIEGRLAGGNLTMLSMLAGTRWAIDLADSVFLLEEITERPYAIDRYLTHLGLLDAFAGARAALVGDFTRCGEKPDTEDELALRAVDERLAHYGIPGLQGLPVGHGPRNLALPWGARCAVDLAAGRLHILDAAVR